MSDDDSTPPTASTSADPPAAVIEAGMELDETPIIWTIKNLDIVLQDDHLTNSQRMEVCTGERISRPTKWSFVLQVSLKGGSRYVGVVRTMIEPTVGNIPPDLYSEVIVEVKAPHNVDPLWTYCGQAKCVGDQPMECGNMEMLNADTFKEVSVDIHIKLRLFRIAEPVTPMEELIMEFKAELETRKAQQDMQRALNIPPRSQRCEVKLISSDHVEYLASRRILAVRSPGMLRGLRRTRPNHEEVIRLPEVSSTTLEVLLHFIVDCKLHDNWRSVIVELTKAASTYQLHELLDFLDLVIGRSCDVQNAGQLLKLAHEVRLTTAENEVLGFIKKNMIGSVEDFLHIFDGTPSAELVAPVEQPEVGPAAGTTSRPRQPWRKPRGHGWAVAGKRKTRYE